MKLESAVLSSLCSVLLIGNDVYLQRFADNLQETFFPCTRNWSCYFEPPSLQT